MPTGNAPAGDDDAGFSPRMLILMLCVALVWGLNWQVMKVALREIPPVGFRAFTALASGAGLMLIACLMRQPLRPPKGKWPVLILLAITNITGWNILSIYGILLLPSGRAALLAYTMPMWSILLSALWLGNPLTLRRLAGMLLGTAGVSAMMGAELASIAGAPWGVALMVGAAFVWALGLVSIKRFPVVMPTLTFSGWLMLLGGAMSLPFTLFEDISPWWHLSFWPLFAVLYNVFVSLMFCTWAWYSIVRHLPVAVSSLSSLIVPLIGVAGGILLLDEQLSRAEWAGMACILGAVATVVLPARVQKTVSEDRGQKIVSEERGQKIVSEDRGQKIEDR
ncbi:MAG: DMT family transporter [Candidatus Accumulibacter sp.]|jgi:drug/metabolite transporter (DMT)-like permease|nr:DMT family transporter [Accumulibacter sp.]